MCSYRFWPGRCACRCSREPPSQTPGVQGVKVVATSADGKTKYAEAVTDAKGRFGLTHLPAGDVLLTFTAPAGWQIMTGEDGKYDHTPAQVIAEEGDEANVNVPAKKVAVTSPSASASASAGPGLPVTGDNTMLFVGAGAVAVVIGAALVLVARRRVHLQA
ncbi:SdrD B-like domain-containing protein [Dactylosporangium sp. CA-152071]|uniref:SdrD B-like domain-containing protein n=1 Tax=Dactylosporangium sp. CA-152071 TaxID=3239933 RepID=UPI003D90B33E